MYLYCSCMNRHITEEQGHNKTETRDAFSCESWRTSNPPARERNTHRNWNIASRTSVDAAPTASSPCRHCVSSESVLTSSGTLPLPSRLLPPPFWAGPFWVFPRHQPRARAQSSLSILFSSRVKSSASNRASSRSTAVQYESLVDLYVEARTTPAPISRLRIVLTSGRASC